MLITGLSSAVQLHSIKCKSLKFESVGEGGEHDQNTSACLFSHGGHMDDVMDTPSHLGGQVLCHVWYDKYTDTVLPGQPGNHTHYHNHDTTNMPL